MQDFSCLCGISAGGMVSPVGKHHLPPELLRSPMSSVIPVGSLNRIKRVDEAQNHSPHLCAGIGTHGNMLTIILY